MFKLFGDNIKFIGFIVGVFIVIVLILLGVVIDNGVIFGGWILILIVGVFGVLGLVGIILIVGGIGVFGVVIVIFIVGVFGSDRFNFINKF